MQTLQKEVKSHHARHVCRSPNRGRKRPRDRVHSCLAGSACLPTGFQRLQIGQFRYLSQACFTVLFRGYVIAPCGERRRSVSWRHLEHGPPFLAKAPLGTTTETGRIRIDDNQTNPATAFHHAHWTFSGRIITPIIERLLPEPEKAHAVEIGYGDGALLVPASSFFGRVTGVAMGQGDLDGAKVKLLVVGAAWSISFAEWRPSTPLPFEDGSLDFIYSLHGVRRLPDLRAFSSLITDCARVLKPGGLAMLWFGRLSRLPFAPPGRAWLRGYDIRPDSQTGEPTLHVRMFHARKAVLDAGMKAVSLSTPLHPDTSWRLLRGGHLSFITAWKP